MYPFIASTSCLFSLKCLHPAKGLSAMKNNPLQWLEASKHVLVKPGFIAWFWAVVKLQVMKHWTEQNSINGFLGQDQHKRCTGTPSCAISILPRDFGISYPSFPISFHSCFAKLSLAESWLMEEFLLPMGKEECVFHWQKSNAVDSFKLDSLMSSSEMLVQPADFCIC